MNEKEAKSFIAAEVSRLLWGRLGAIASLFGIANFIALVALWNSITSNAHRVAEQQVKKSAEEFAIKQLDKFAEVTQSAKEHISELNTSYRQLYTKVGEANVGFKLLESDREQLQKEFLELTSKATTIRASIDVFQSSDVGRVAQVVNVLNTLETEDAKKLMSSIEAAFRESRRQAESNSIVLRTTTEGLATTIATVNDLKNRTQNIATKENETIITIPSRGSLHFGSDGNIYLRSNSGEPITSLTKILMK